MKNHSRCIRVIKCIFLAFVIICMGTMVFTAKGILKSTQPAMVITKEAEAEEKVTSQVEKIEKEKEKKKKEEPVSQPKEEPLEEEMPETEKVEEGHLIENFPIILQMPELPTGCEVTALTMALQYYGWDADKTVLAETYLPQKAWWLYYGADGLLYGPDLNSYFIGDPSSEDGGVCGPQAIVAAADGYLSDQGSTLRAVDKTGASPEELYELINENTPIVVWVTISMAPRADTEGWYTESGKYVEWSTNDHGAVLIGYTDDTVILADPISGQCEYNKEAFEEVFASRNRQCVILK